MANRNWRCIRSLSAVPPLLSNINTLTILAVGGLLVMDGDLSMGGLVAFQSLMASFMGPISDLVNLGSTLQEVEGDMNRLDDVLVHETDEPFSALASASTETQPKLDGHLEFRNVSFGYSPLDPR